MSIIVEYEVSPPDPERFITTSKKFQSVTEQAGGKPIGVFRLEADPNRFLIVEEWESHDRMHKVSDEHGDKFNSEAGTEGLEWVTRVWTRTI